MRERPANYKLREKKYEYKKYEYSETGIPQT